ncbi:MAG: helix-turn-helix domain-containing protein [Candidatus Nanopelagicales bacterium]
MGELTARGLATRARVVAAARDVFADRGFAATRMGDIAEAAGVAHGTVYTYFDSKEDVLLGVLDHVRTDLQAAMGVAVTRSPHAGVEAANRAYLEAHRRNALMLRAAEEASSRDERFANLLLDLWRTHVARVAVVIRKFQADGVASPDLDPNAAAAALCGMAEGFASHWADRGERLHGRGEAADEVLAIRTLTQLWVRGLGIPEPDAPTRAWAAGADRRNAAS